MKRSTWPEIKQRLEYFNDDVYLAALVNSAHEKRPRPWWHWFFIVVGVGMAILAPIAWWLR